MILITFASVILYVNSVRSGLILNEENKYVERFKREADAKPLQEEYFSVPVAIFYEESNRQEKSIETTVSTSVANAKLTIPQEEPTEPSISTLIPTESDDVDVEEIVDTTTPNLSISSVESSPNVLINNNLNTTPRINNERRKVAAVPQAELFIPVAVVYDDPDNTQQHNKPVKMGRKLLSSQQRTRNNGKGSEILDKEQNESTLKEKHTNENIRTGTFPKRTQKPDPFIKIVQSENFVYSNSGDFHYSYEGTDGTKAFERGELGSDKGGEVVEGSFSYIGKDGKDYSLTYTADENGYRPVGAHLPTPPPIPPAIARALQYLATKPTSESITEHYY